MSLHVNATHRRGVSVGSSQTGRRLSAAARWRVPLSWQTVGRSVGAVHKPRPRFTPLCRPADRSPFICAGSLAARRRRRRRRRYGGGGTLPSGAWACRAGWRRRLTSSHHVGTSRHPCSRLLPLSAAFRASCCAMTRFDECEGGGKAPRGSGRSS